MTNIKDARHLETVAALAESLLKRSEEMHASFEFHSQRIFDYIKSLDPKTQEEEILSAYKLLIDSNIKYKAHKYITELYK